MKIRTGALFSVFLTLVLIFAGLNEAEARRFGGGGNFGGRSAYSAPYQRSAQPTRPANQQQQQAGRQAPGANPALPNRSGLMGLLGGLALGGLLGSMFMGGGFHGINFMDILVFGAIAFFLFKFFAARNASAHRPSYGQPTGGTNQDASYNYQSYDQTPQNRPAGFDTDILFDKNKKETAFTSQSAEQIEQDADFGTAVVPAGFDENGFLNGAKIAYKTLQKAWDGRDLAEIRSLTTDKVFAEIQDQLKASSEENHTDVLKVEAELLEVREIGNEIEAVVLFDVIMREERDAQAGQVREVWTFVKPTNPNVTKWLLDGIQQLAD